MERKGQSALEYLMTYGWALIVIAIVIGVLVFIMSTTTAGSNCTSDNTQLIYVDHAVNLGVLEVTVQNGAGQTITIPTLLLDGITLGGDFAGGTGVGADAQVVSGAEHNIGATGTGLIDGATYRGTIGVKYTRGSGTIDHTATLTCTGTASGTAP